MSISVVIIARNEERWLDRLLDNIQGLGDETIVVDAASDDRTARVARDHGCQVVLGGRPGFARNAGARVASGDHLLFLDADVWLPHGTRDAIPELAGPHLTTCFRHEPITSSRFVRVCYWVMDLWFRGLRGARVYHGLASCLLVSRDVFEVVGGFSEDLEPGEDVDFVRRAGRVAESHYERTWSVLVSDRRFRAENGPKFAMKTVVWELLRLVESQRSIFGYRWTGYREELFERETQILERMKGSGHDAP